MPPRVSRDTSPRASRKFIIDPSDHHHSQAAADNSFTSALDVSVLRPTPLRRRGSDGDSPRYRDSSKYHAKYPTMDNPTDPHPLRNGSTTARAARYDTGSTRPRLSRVLSPGSPAFARPPSPADFPPPDRAEPHRTVLAHEVSPNDTLAGVALKYGISATELRRANQLWASDSIHLRRVLYVPLDKARHADLETVASLLAQRTEGGADTARAPASQHDPHTSDSSPIVQRIPSASFAFFPPSSRAGTPPPGSSFASTTHFHSRSHSPATISTPPRVPSLASNLRSNALSSFFSMLPLSASTRDEIMSRLPIDSRSNSTAGTASDEDEHELTTVPTTPKLRADAPSSSVSAAPLAIGARRRKSPPLTRRSSDPSDRELYARNVERIALASSPIHTTQMQPARTMQLPESMSRSPSKGTPPNDSHNDDWHLLGGDHGRMW